MKKSITLLVVGAMSAASVLPAAAQSASFPTIMGSAKAGTANVEQVNHHYHRRHRGHGVNPGAAAAAGIIGFGLGAAIASQPRYYDAPPPRRYYEGPRYQDDWDAYCFSKYKSYDPRTGTFLGYDGYRHPCR